MNNPAYIILSLLSFRAAIAMELPDTKLNKIRNLLENNASEEKNAQFLGENFGYHPKFEIVNDGLSSPEVETITIAPHGYGGDKNQFGSNFNYQGHRIIFNFKDANQGEGPGLANTSFGQLSEIKPFLYAMLMATQAGYKKVDCIGYSRGGAVVINAIGLLNNDNIFTEANNTQKELECIGINNDNRKELLKLIQDGKLILICPMLELTTAVQAIIKTGAKITTDAIIASSPVQSSLESQYIQLPTRMAQGIWYYVPDFLKNLSKLSFNLGANVSSIGADISAHETAVSASDVALPFISQYRPWSFAPMKSIENFKGLKLATLIHFGTHDPVVGNAHDKEFFKRLKGMNPETTYVHRSDNGHNMGREFYELMALFNARHGAQSNYLGDTSKLDEYKDWKDLTK